MNERINDTNTLGGNVKKKKKRKSHLAWICEFGGNMDLF